MLIFFFCSRYGPLRILQIFICRSNLISLVLAYSPCVIPNINSFLHILNNIHTQFSFFFLFSSLSFFFVYTTCKHHSFIYSFNLHTQFFVLLIIHTQHSWFLHSPAADRLTHSLKNGKWKTQMMSQAKTGVKMSLVWKSLQVIFTAYILVTTSFSKLDLLFSFFFYLAKKIKNVDIESSLHTMKVTFTKRHRRGQHCSALCICETLQKELTGGTCLLRLTRTARNSSEKIHTCQTSKTGYSQWISCCSESEKYVFTKCRNLQCLFETVLASICHFARNKNVIIPNPYLKKKLIFTVPKNTFWT